MAATEGKRRRTLTRDYRGVYVHHVHYGVSLYTDHAVALVQKTDPRGDGRPPRLLCAVRVPLGYLALGGLDPLEAALVLSRAITDALARDSDIRNGAAVPAPPEGVMGAAVDPLRSDVLPGL